MPKTILITGASSGIGRATAELLVRDGHRVLTLARSREILKGLVKKYKNAKAYPCDLRNLKETFSVAKKILAENKRIDVLVNNAGVGFPTRLDELKEGEYCDIMDTNVKGLIFLTREILKRMKKQNSGHIINISSPAGQRSNPVAPIYCASKFAVEGYTEGLRLQIKEEKKDIRVTLVRPGGVDTNYWGKREVAREKFMRPEEMARVLKFAIDFPEKSNVQEITLESVRY